jgi:hypothetical protein
MATTDIVISLSNRKVIHAVLFQWEKGIINWNEFEKF